MTSRARYDEIGRSYSATRREDPRIAALVHECVGPGASLVNVGAGTGNYEPRDRFVVAVEPSEEMISQRVDRSTAIVRAVAEALPFADGAFAAASALLTVHHWTDPSRGLRELARVARRQVVLFWEDRLLDDLWAFEYFGQPPPLPYGEAFLRQHLVVHDVRVVAVPRDCEDGFGAAYWARPEGYLDPDVQAGMSWLALMPASARKRGSGRLARDLATGRWDERFGHLRDEHEHDWGYRIAVAGGTP
jgi:SAM-dependent methyltransferase